MSTSTILNSGMPQEIPISNTHQYDDQRYGSYGLFLVGPTLIVILLITLSGTSTAKHTNQYHMSSPMVLSLQIWSLILLFMCFVSEFYWQEHISLPMKFLSIILGTSGLLAQQNSAQVIFHVSTTCSWYGIFDMYVRSSPSSGFGVFLNPGWIIAVFMCSASILRVHMGNAWQINNPAYMTVGLVLLLSYFWNVEFPTCNLTFLRYAGICDVMGHTPVRFTESIFHYDYRLVGMFAAAAIHSLNAVLLYSLIPQESLDTNLIVSTTAESTIKTTSDSSVYPTDGITNKLVANVGMVHSGSGDIMETASTSSVSTVTSAPGFPASYSMDNCSDTATLEKIYNSPKSNATANAISGNMKFNANLSANKKSNASTSSLTETFLPSGGAVPVPIACDHGFSSASTKGIGSSCNEHVARGQVHRVFTIPDDCVEITEEEAIRIVERGLRKFKTMRAN